MIQKVTYYLCTICDKEYPDVTSVYIRCTNDIHQEGDDGCESCMYQCFSEKFETRSRLQGCGRWFCKDCIGTTNYFEPWYPKHLCNHCIIKYGLVKFYGEDNGEALWNEIEQWRLETFGSRSKPKVKKILIGEETGRKGDVGFKVKKYTEGEIQQRIFERYYTKVDK